MIELREVVYRYDGTAAVDGVSLTIPAGSFVVLAGPNGSGKTTLVRVFNGLLEPDEGAVVVDGQPVAANPVAARTSVGMVFQHPRDQFVASTVRADVAFGPENLGLDRGEIDRRVDRALSAASLEGRNDDRVATLSGGEQARLAIAGALAMEPDYLVLDEPFTSLDEPARRSVLDHLAALNDAGTGVIVVTHQLRGLLSRVDRVLGMVDGRIAADVPPREVDDAFEGIDVYVPPLDGQARC